jgi:membrane-associated phospholipid phosphatase
VLRKTLLLVAAYAAIALVVVGFGWLITHSLEGPVDGVDDDVARWFADQRAADLDPLAEGGTLLGETWFGLVVGTVVGAASWVLDRTLRGPVVVALASAGDGGLYWLGTHLDPRDRPPVHLMDSGLVPNHSFPSGHVGTAVAVYGAAALLLALRLRSTSLRRAAVVVLCAVPFVVAVARLYEGAHHLTDVGASLVYGAVWLTVVLVTVRPRARRRERDLMPA